MRSSATTSDRQGVGRRSSSRATQLRLRRQSHRWRYRWVGEPIAVSSVRSIAVAYDLPPFATCAGRVRGSPPQARIPLDKKNLTMQPLVAFNYQAIIDGGGQVAT